MADLAANLALKFKAIGTEDIVARIKAIGEALREQKAQGIAVGAIAKIISTENKRILDEERLKTAELIAEKKRLGAADAAAAKVGQAAAQQATAAAKQAGVAAALENAQARKINAERQAALAANPQFIELKKVESANRAAAAASMATAAADRRAGVEASAKARILETERKALNQSRTASVAAANATTNLSYTAKLAGDAMRGISLGLNLIKVGKLLPDTKLTADGFRLLAVNAEKLVNVPLVAALEGTANVIRKMGGAFLDGTVGALARYLQKAGGFTGILTTAITKTSLALLRLPVTTLKSIVGLITNIAGKLGTGAINAVKGIGKAIISIPLAPLRAFNNIFSDVSRIILGMVGFQGLRAIGRSLSELTQQAGPMEAVRTQFVNFMQQARYNIDGFNTSADAMIKQMQYMTGGALDMTTMLKSSNLAFALIGDQVGKDLPQLMGIAQAAALTTGQDVNYMIESLARGIGRLSTRWIDNTGISMDATSEYRRYAEEIGKSFNTLNQAERTQALLNGTLREGAKILLRTGDITVFLQTQMAKFGANMRNVRDGVITAFAPFATVALTSINNFLDVTGPAVVDWSEGFVRQFARIGRVASDVLPAALAGMGEYANEIASQSSGSLESGSRQMGRKAADWAVNALTWGANVGSQFIIGIMNGFSQFIAVAMNFISSVLANWLAPGSPPRVAPDIDKWGAATIGEFVNGMISYPIHSAFPQLKEEIRAQLGQDVKDNLFEWGVDAIASWAEGLATIDLEFIAYSIDIAISAAKRLNEELTASYKSQRSELFKLQVLNRDKTGIKAQIQKVNTSKLALNANEIQLRQLEAQKALVQEQIELFRLLERAIKEQQDRASSDKANKESGGGGDGNGSVLDDLMDRPVQIPLEGTDLLKRKVAGIGKMFEDIFKDPLQNIKDSFITNSGLIGTAFTNLKKTVETNMPKLITKFNNFKIEVGKLYAELKLFYDTVKTEFPIVKTKIGEFIIKMGEFGTAVGTFFSEDIKVMGETLKAESPKIIQAIQDIAGFKEVWGIIAGIIGVILSGIMGVITGFVKYLGWFSDRISDFIAGVKKQWTKGNFWEGAGEIFVAGVQIALGGFKLLWNVITEGLAGIMRGVLAVMGTDGERLGRVWKYNWESLNLILKQVWLNILTTTIGSLGNIIKVIENSPFGKQLKDLLGLDGLNITETWTSFGTEMLAGIQTGIDEQREAMSIAIQGPIAKAGEIVNLSTTYDGYLRYGANIPASMATGIANSTRLPLISLENILQGLSSTGEGIDYSGLGMQIATETGDGIRENTGYTSMAAGDMSVESLSALQYAGGGTASPSSPLLKFVNQGKNMATSIGSGITTQTAYVSGAMSKLMTETINAVSGASNSLNTEANNVMQQMCAAMIAQVQREDTFYAVGLAITAGIKTGMSDSLPDFKKYAWDYAKDIEGELREAWGLPSKGGASSAPIPPKKKTDSGTFSIPNFNNKVPTTDRATTTTIIVNVNAPIVGQMLVPNMTTGREMSKQISKDIGAMAQLRRTPA